MASNSDQTVIIVGGGVVGLSIAWELARRGRRVQVLERGKLGREASWAGAGILPPAAEYPGAHAYSQLCALSHRLHPQWSQQLHLETEIENGYSDCGGIYVARSAGEGALLNAMIGMFREEAVAVESISLKELPEREPGLAGAVEADQIHSACLLPKEAQLRNPRHLKALQEACRRRGVQLGEEAEVLSFELKSGRIESVTTTVGDFRADQFCLCSGAWSKNVLSSLNVTLSVIPVCGQMVLFKSPQSQLRHIVNEGPRYLVPRPDGHLLAGSSEEEIGLKKRTTDVIIDELIAFARSLVHSLRDASIENTWAGLRPGSFDGFPYLGKIPAVENGFVATGHYRSGLFLSPATAVVMTQLMSGETPSVDLSAFRVGRG